MTGKKPKTGGEIDAYCAKCKLDLAHRIIAMVGEAVKKVECKTCGKPTFAGCGAHVEQVLAGVPGLLAQCFKRLHQQQPEPLVACHQEMQSALLAELALRLEPIEGMLEALSQASPPDPHIPEDARRP